MAGPTEIDRRWVFLLLAIVVSASMIRPYRQPVEPNVRVRKVYEFIDALKPGDAVLISLDFDPQAKAELQPMSKALLRHCFKKNLRVVGMTFWPQGADMAARIMDEVAREKGKIYGKDYAFLGLKPAGMLIVLTSMGEDLKRTFDQDTRGLQTSTLEVLKGINRLGDFSLLVDIAAGATVQPWVLFAGDKYKVPLAAGCTAVSGPDLYVFLDTKQLVGLIAGLVGVADYEKLIDEPADGTRGMAAQTSAHVLIIVLIVLGNLFYFLRRRKRRDNSQYPQNAPPPDESKELNVGPIILIILLALFVAINLVLILTGQLRGTELGVPTVKITLGKILAVFVTFAMFSYLYRDNPVFRAVENLYVGVGLGVTTSIVWFMYFKPEIYDKLIEPLFSSTERIQPGDYWLLLPIVLGILMLTRISRNLGWLSRYTVAFMVGYGAGLSIQPAIHSTIIKQSYQTIQIQPIPWQVGLFFGIALLLMIAVAWYAGRTGGNFGTYVKIAFVLIVFAYAGMKILPQFEKATRGLDSILLLMGVITVMSYFFFSAEHKGILGKSSRLGIVFLMVSFGASFGFTVMARESLLIGRLQFLLGDWLGILPK